MTKDGCTKQFPKKFCAETTIDQNGFPLHMRKYMVFEWVLVKGVENGTYSRKVLMKRENRVFQFYYKKDTNVIYMNKEF